MNVCIYASHIYSSISQCNRSYSQTIAQGPYKLYDKSMQNKLMKGKCFHR